LSSSFLTKTSLFLSKNLAKASKTLVKPKRNLKNRKRKQIPTIININDPKRENNSSSVILGVGVFIKLSPLKAGCFRGYRESFAPSP
jgi:hypothetical protein